jgi:hypothetical protein
LLFRRANHHLGCELHSRGVQVERRQDVPPEGAHSAMDVAHARLAEEVQETAQDRIADVTVQPWHCAGLDAVHPIAHDELSAVVELVDEARDVVEVVRQIGVDHDHVVAARSAEAGEVGAAVAAPRLEDDARAGGAGELAASVLRAVVDDDHFAGDPVLFEHRVGKVDAQLDVLRLVQARDHDRDTDLAFGVASGGRCSKNFYRRHVGSSSRGGCRSRRP